MNCSPHQCLIFISIEYDLHSLHKFIDNFLIHLITMPKIVHQRIYIAIECMTEHLSLLQQLPIERDLLDQIILHTMLSSRSYPPPIIKVIYANFNPIVPS